MKKPKLKSVTTSAYDFKESFAFLKKKYKMNIELHKMWRWIWHNDLLTDGLIILCEDDYDFVDEDWQREFLERAIEEFGDDDGFVSFWE